MWVGGGGGGEVEEEEEVGGNVKEKQVNAVVLCRVAVLCFDSTTCRLQCVPFLCAVV